MPLIETENLNIVLAQGILRPKQGIDTTMHCHPVLQVAVLVSVSFGNPVPSSKAKLAPDVPDILTEVLNKAANFSNDISYELSQLEVKISDITTGKINPVSTIEKCLSTLSSISSNRNKTILQKAIDVVSVGLVSTSTIDILNGVTNHEINSVTNNNTKNPVPPIYPTKFPADAPYNIPETALRGAIYIPPILQLRHNQQNPRRPHSWNRRSSWKHLLLQLCKAVHGKSTYRPSMGQHPRHLPGRHPEQRGVRRIRDKLHSGGIARRNRGTCMVARQRGRAMGTEILAADAGSGKQLPRRERGFSRDGCGDAVRTGGVGLSAVCAAAGVCSAVY